MDSSVVLFPQRPLRPNSALFCRFDDAMVDLDARSKDLGDLKHAPVITNLIMEVCDLIWEIGNNFGACILLFILNGGKNGLVVSITMFRAWLFVLHQRALQQVCGLKEALCSVYGLKGMDSSDGSRDCFPEHEMTALGRRLHRVKEGVMAQKRQLHRFKDEMEERLEQVEEVIHETRVDQMEQAAIAKATDGSTLKPFRSSRTN